MVKLSLTALSKELANLKHKMEVPGDANTIIKHEIE